MRALVHGQQSVLTLTGTNGDKPPPCKNADPVAATPVLGKTRAVFERYNIVSHGDLNGAARRLLASRGHNYGHNRP